MLNYHYELNICGVKKKKKELLSGAQMLQAPGKGGMYSMHGRPQHGWSTQDCAFENAYVALALAASLSL